MRNEEKTDGAELTGQTIPDVEGTEPRPSCRICGEVENNINHALTYGPVRIEGAHKFEAISVETPEGYGAWDWLDELADAACYNGQANQAWANEIRDRVQYLESQLGSGNPDASAERAQATPQERSAIDNLQSASVSQSLEECKECQCGTKWIGAPEVCPHCHTAISGVPLARQQLGGLVRRMLEQKPTPYNGPITLKDVVEAIDALILAVSAPLKAENERLAGVNAKLLREQADWSQKFHDQKERAESLEAALAEAKGEIEKMRNEQHAILSTLSVDDPWLAVQAIDSLKASEATWAGQARYLMKDRENWIKAAEAAEQALAALREQTDQEKTYTRSDQPQPGSCDADPRGDQPAGSEADQQAADERVRVRRGALIALIGDPSEEVLDAIDGLIGASTIAAHAPALGDAFRCMHSAQFRCPQCPPETP